LTKATHIEFTLTAELTDSASSVTADVDDYYEGRHPDPKGNGITLYNKEASGSPANFIFEGDSGDKGMAIWDRRNKRYRIWQMECP
jgi:hypothetical protein